MNIAPTRLGNIPEIAEEMSEETLREIEQRIVNDMEKIRSLGATNEETKQTLLIPYGKLLQEIAFARWQREKFTAIDAFKEHLKTVAGTCQITKKRIRHALGAILREGDVKLEVRRRAVIDMNLSRDIAHRLNGAQIKTIGDLLEAGEEKWGVLKQRFAVGTSGQDNKTYNAALIEIANMLTDEGVNRETVMAILQRAAMANIVLQDWRDGREDDSNNEEDDEIPEGLVERKLYGNEDSKLDLCVEAKIRAILEREGIDTVQKALSMKIEDWKKIKGLGYSSREKLANALKELGIPRQMVRKIYG